MVNKLIMLMVIISLTGCSSMKATQSEGVLILKCWGSCEAEFPNGAKVKKGLIKFPSIPPVRLSP